MPMLKSFTPEMFGAAGDGVTNDSDAFARMSAAVNAAGGGTVVLRQTTYIVGGQTPDSSGLWAWAPATIMTFDGCTKSLTIQGNNAILKCADGLKYGTFDPATGLATHNPMPFTGTQQRASPYDSMILIQNCTGQVGIKGIELDGNVGGLNIGGTYGDTGWQIPAVGLRLLNNVGGEWIVGVHSHHHAEDGLYFDGMPGRSTSTQVSECTSEYNGRQGCSIVGGCNYFFDHCGFNHTGRGGLSSAPGAGVDIEAEVNSIRNVSFSSCMFANNSGAGMGADSGDSAGATFDDCLFVGTTTWSAWPNKPNFRFTNSRFVGAMCHAFPSSDPTQAAQFLNCAFLDDPTLSPTGEVFGPSQPIANLGSGDLNVLFDGCTFTLKNQLVLPWSVSALYNNCTMSQVSSDTAFPRGTYTGTDSITGPVALYSSKIVGQLTLNGQIVAPTNFASY